MPSFQRDFKWTKKIVLKLLDDLNLHRICYTGVHTAHTYYMGNILVLDDGGEKYVVDGQQRLIALTIVAAAVRDTAIKVANFSAAHTIQTKIINDQHRNASFEAYDNGNADSNKNQLASLQKIFIPTITKRRWKCKQNFAPGAVQISMRTSSLKEPIWKMMDGVIEFEHGARLTLNMTNEPAVLDNPAPLKFRDLVGVLSGNNVAVDEKGEWVEHPDFRLENAALDGGDLIKRYKECCRRISSIIRGKDPDEKRELIEHFANVLLNLQFTVTKFTNMPQAIQYFGKFNDPNNKIDLTVGDLMRQWTHYVSRETPIDAVRDPDIRDLWGNIDTVLNIESVDGKDHLQDFFTNYLIANNKRYTKDDVFMGIEENYIGMQKELGPRYAQTILYEHPNWQKEYIKDMMTKLTFSANIYSEICDSRDMPIGHGHPHAARLRAIMKSGVIQARALLLAGMEKFRREQVAGNLSATACEKAESYLIGVVEYFIVRGTIIPKCVDRALTPNPTAVPADDKALDGKIAHAKVELWCKNIREHGILTHYGRAGRAVNEDAAVLIDDIRDEVVSLCAKYGDFFEDAGSATDAVKSLDVENKYAQLILIRLEISRGLWTTPALADYEVEHIFPKNPEPGDWVAFAGVKEENLEKLGNKTLLPSEWNNDMSNQEYAQKQTDPVRPAHDAMDYTRAAVGRAIKLCDELSTTTPAHFAVWTPAEVTQRSETLGDETYTQFSDAALDSSNF